MARKFKQVATPPARERAAEWTRRLGQADWERSVRQLARDLGGTARAARAAPDPHAMIQELLALYVSEELAGVHVREAYRQVTEHLANCTECATAYRMIAAALEAEGAARQDAPGVAWTRQDVFSNVHLKQVMYHLRVAGAEPPSRGSTARGGAPLPALRARRKLGIPLTLRGGLEVKESLLFRDQIHVPEGSLNVRASISFPYTAADRFDLRVELSGAPALVRRVRAQVHSDRETAQAAFSKRGYACFKRMSFADSAAPLRLVLELDGKPVRQTSRAARA